MNYLIDAKNFIELFNGDPKMIEAIDNLVKKNIKLITACENYEKTFVTIEAQMTLRPDMFKVWKTQMEFLLGNARNALKDNK